MDSQYGLVSPFICFVASAMFKYQFGVIVGLISLLIGCLVMLIVVINNRRDKKTIRRRKRNGKNIERRNTNDRRTVV